MKRYARRARISGRSAPSVRARRAHPGTHPPPPIRPQPLQIPSTHPSAGTQSPRKSGTFSKPRSGTFSKPIDTDKPWIAWDDRLIGFGVRIQPSGAKAFVVNYRTGSGGRKARNRRIAWWPPSPTRWTSSTSTGLTPFRAGSYGTRRASPFQVRVSARFGPPRRPSMPKVCVDGTSSWSVLEERFRSLSAPGFAARSRFRIPILTQPTRQNAPQQTHTKFPSHFERIDESPPTINTRATRMEAAALPHCGWRCVRAAAAAARGAAVKLRKCPTFSG